MGIEELVAIATLGSILAATIIILYLLYSYYRIKSRKMELIDKGIWKTEYEQTQQKSTLLSGSIFMAIGISVLMGASWPGQINVKIEVSAGVALLLVGVTLVVNHFLERLYP